MIFTLAWITWTPNQAFAENKLTWQTYIAGMTRAKDEKKKVLVYFRADWCQYCTVMDRDVFSNPKIIKEIQKNFIPIRVDVDKEKTIATQYQIQGLPTTWFLTQDGRRIGGIPGSFPPEIMANILPYIASDSYLTMTMEDYIAKRKTK